MQPVEAYEQDQLEENYDNSTYATQDDETINEGANMPENSQQDIQNSQAGQSSQAPVEKKNQPKLIISSYSMNPKMAEAGSNFDLSITLYNTNYENGIYNLKMSLDPNMQSQPQTTSENQNVSSGSVFVPVNSSNTFYTQAIYPWQTDTKNIKLNVLPNAAAGNYVMNVNFEYEDADGTQYQTTESIGIAVVQKSEVSTSEIMLDELSANTPSSISMDIFNTGKDNLSNFMVKVEGEGFDTDQDSYFIGNLQAGAQESFQATITPKEAGEINGKIVMTYEDSTGEEHKEEKEFKKEAIDMPQDQYDENGNLIDPETGEVIGANPGGNGAFYTNGIFWVGLVIVLVLLALLIRKRRKKKKEEQELTIDE